MKANQVPHTYEVVLHRHLKTRLLIEAGSPQQASRLAAAYDPDILNWTLVRQDPVSVDLRLAAGNKTFCGCRQRDDFGRTDLEEETNPNDLEEVKQAA